MTKSKASKLSTLTLLAVFVLLSVVLGIFFGTHTAEKASSQARVGERILLASGGSVVLMDNGTSSYQTLVYGTAPHAGVAGVANELTEKFSILSDVELSFVSESASTPTTNVVTYGRVTNVPLSVRLADTVDALPADSVAWGIAYENGVLAFYANSKTALSANVSKTSAKNELYVDLYAALSEYVSDGKLAVPETLFRVQEITKAEYDNILAEDEAKFEAEKVAERAQKVEALKNKINTEFNTPDFGTPETGNTLTTDFGTAASGTPDYYPTAGQHPRVLFTEADIPAIKASIEAKKGTDEYRKFISYLERENFDGKLGEPKTDSRGYHNWSGDTLAAIQANALAYAVYGEEYYGYTAIYAMKNFLMTLNIDYIKSDQCREFGMVMYIAACVYDWCYDLLTAEDKIQIPLGVEHKLCRGNVPNTMNGILSTSSTVKMEMGFPPKNQAALVGHGSEFQLMRDYLAMSIAVFDEMPGWYEFVGGRMYNEYIPVRQQYYSAGLYPQGMSCYGPWRFLADCYGAALIQAATGRSPYSEDMAKVVFTFASNETSAGNMFSTGDGSSTSLPSSSIGMEALVISHVIYDTASAPLLRLMANSMITSCTGVSVSTVLCPEYFIFTAREVEKMENTTWRDELPRVTYTGDYVGQYLARNEWSDNAAVVMMRVGERTTANHDHEDAGTFQIYYKGLTTGSSGGYGTYGSDHWQYYHQATVAHNGILIFDSSKADTVPQQNMNPDGSPKVDSYGNYSYANESRLFYSGGQSANRSEPSNLQSWLNGSHDRADVKGYASGYGADGVTPSFAYIAGDLTKAYSTSQSSYVGRSMLTAYTGNPDYPMVFFVFDRIDAMDEDFVKKFLLQINGENAPVIDQDNKTVKVEEGSGQLVLQNVLGADKIEGIGGGYVSNFIINGVNCQDNSFKKLNSWGRVELSTTRNLSDLMLNVIYVSDKGNTNLLKATGIKGVDKKTGDKVMLEGATIGNVTALFSTEMDRTVEQIVFTAEGDELMTYYVGGLFEGTWNISVDGEKVGTVYSTYNSGFLSFKAPAGKEIMLTPGNDIRPAGSEKLTYVTMGGTFDKKVDSFYMPGAGEALYTGITRGYDIFDGWYLDREFTIPANPIPTDVTGPLTVYAKWTSVFANEDYLSTEINIENKTSGSAEANGVQYTISDGAYTTYKTESKDGVNYLFWQTLPNPQATSNEGKNGRGPSLFVKPASSSIASMNGEQITYIFKLADAGTTADMEVNVRVRNADSQETSFFTVSGGKVVFDGEEVASLYESKFITVSVVLDFAKGEVKLYASTSHTEYVKSVNLPPRASFTTELLSMRANSEGAVKIGLIRVYEGDKGYIIKGEDVPDNYIEFPSEAIIPEGTDLSFVPDGDTVIPTEGITTVKDGITYVVDGWYSDAALQDPVTTVPDGVSEKFTVYAKWRQANIIYYPEEANLPSAEYVPGETVLPTGISGVQDGYNVTLLGWYLDEAFTQQVTVVPADAEGALFLYAKWNEPNYVKYPDGVVLPTGAPAEYVTGTATPLPETATHALSADFKFLGWYKDMAFTERIYEIPANASGKFEVFAKWDKVIMNFVPDTQTSGGPITGHGYCAVHSDTDNNGICEICGFCAAGCADTNSDGNCDKCSFAMQRCGNASSDHPDANTDARCDRCNVDVNNKSKGTINGLGFEFSEFVAGYMSVVENGDNDYLKLYVKSGNGPAFNYNGELSMYDALKNSQKHQIVYQFDLAAEEGAPIMPFHMRLRWKGDSPTAIFTVNADGTFTTGSTVIPGYKLTAEMTKVTIVFDFDNGEIRYYFGNSLDAAAKRVWAMPPIYSSVEDWIQTEFPTAGYGIMQNRIQGPGTLLIGGIKIFADDDGEYDVSENQIKYPEGITLPKDAPKTYKPGVTELPTDVTTIKDGVIYELEGWYSDAALQNKKTVVPDGASGEYQVYAKWVEKNYVIYPTEANLPDTMPIEYAPGVAPIPLPTAGVTGNLLGKTVTLQGWYLDEALTQPITEIPVTAIGAFRVYAKWNEPNTISYPSSVKVESSFPEDYVAGETALPENPQYNGAGEATFIGWYADEACTQKITVVPANAVGIFKVYAVFSKTLLDLDVEAGDTTGTVTGSNYCAHNDSDSNGICEACGRCAAGCETADANHNCTICGKCMCSYASNGGCSYCNTNRTHGTLGLSGVAVNFTDNAPGYATVVENGDSDYTELYIASGNGPLYNYSGTDSISSFLSGMDRHVLVYSFELSAKANTPIMNAQFRFRPNNSATGFFEVKTDGTLTNCGGAKISVGSFTKVTVVVDFDNEIIKYYVGDSAEAAGTKAWTKPSQFATTEEWLAAYYAIAGFGAFQVRMSSVGAILIGDISITANDARYI